MRRLIIPITISIIFLGVVWNQFNMSRWEKQNVIIWDVIQYYAYLPAVVNHDIALADSITNKDFSYKSWTHDGPLGKKVIMTSCGVAILYSPFFLTQYLIDTTHGVEVNTFAPRYHRAISLSVILYLLIGMILLAQVLKRHFSEWTTAFTIFLVVLGTNLFYYSTAEPGMSHAFGFFLFAWFIWTVQRWYADPSWWRSILLGLVFGFTILVRPTNGLIGLVFLFYRPSSMGFRIMISNWTKILVIGLAAFLAFSPQMIYWKHVAGQWLYFSYGEESFYFNNPHILQGLFSFRKGWFIYTPMMLFAVAGLFTKRMPKEYRVVLYTFLPLNIYLILSWWCWWYGGSFGLRAFIESYALLAIPLAAMVETALRSKPLLKLALITSLVLVLFLNQFQTYQYKMALIHWDSMTLKAYKASFLTLKFPEGYAELLKEPDYDKARKGEDED